MFAFPTVPGWDGIHPALVMFPVALLIAAPLLVVASFFAGRAWRSWAAAALFLMALGTVLAWFAVSSGHAAGQLVDKTRDLEQAILRHEALGTNARNLFTLLTVLWAVLVMLPAWLKRPLPPGLRIGVHVLFLAGYVASAGALARTADAGGRLVHERGVHAMVEAPMAKINPTPPAAK